MVLGLRNADGAKTARDGSRVEERRFCKNGSMGVIIVSVYGLA
jgi:hypothetical protein